MIALCGTCAHRTRASTRWSRQTAAALTGCAGLVCDGCARTALSERFRHAVFCASAADLKMAERDVAAVAP